MTTRILPIPHVSQLDKAFCFYACTSMVLKYFGINKSMQDVANEIFTPNIPLRGEDDLPSDIEQFSQTCAVIKDYLSDLGLEAHIYSDQTWGNIEEHIQKGHALIAGVKSNPSDYRPNHAWVLRGILVENDAKKIIYNNPQDDLSEDVNPITYDPNGDGMPGRTTAYEKFLEERWKAPIPLSNRTLLAVSYKGLGLGRDHTDWRNTPGRTAGGFIYHSNRMTEACINGQLIEAFTEATIAGINGVATIAGGVQMIGQFIENGGKAIIDKGVKWANREGIGYKALGVISIIIGAGIAGIGYVLDGVAGVVGMILEGIASLVDWATSVLSGSAGGSKTKTLGDSIQISIGLLVKAEPWQSRIGKNWEKIYGSWFLNIFGEGPVDRITVNWRVQVSGWGIDSWSLSRDVLWHDGDLVREDTGASSNHVKRFETELKDAWGMAMKIGKNKCHYGRDGGITRIQLRVRAVAYKGDENVTITKKINTYGLST